MDTSDLVSSASSPFPKGRWTFRGARYPASQGSRGLGKPCRLPGGAAPSWLWAAGRRRRGRAGHAQEATPAALLRPGQGRLGAVSGLGLAACGWGTAGPCLSRSAPRGNYRGARHCGRAPRGSARWLEAFKLKAALGRGGGRGSTSKGRGRPGTATPLSAPAEGRNSVVSAAPPPRARAKRRSQLVPTLPSRARTPSPPGLPCPCSGSARSSRRPSQTDKHL